MRYILSFLLFLVASTSFAQDITTGLQLWAKFDNDATDSSGNGRNGTLVNTPVYATGQLNQAIDCESGSSQYVDFGNNVGIDNVSACTIGGWFWVESGNNYAPLAADGSATATARIYLGLGGPGVSDTTAIMAVVANGGNTYGYTAAGAIPVNTWVHVSMVFDGSGGTNADRLKVYVNGVNTALTFVGTIPSTTFNGSSNPFRVSNVGTMYFDGKSDEVRVYNRALNSTDAAALHAYTGFTPKISPSLLNQIITRFEYDGKETQCLLCFASGLFPVINQPRSRRSLTGSVI